MVTAARPRDNMTATAPPIRPPVDLECAANASHPNSISAAQMEGRQ